MILIIYLKEKIMKITDLNYANDVDMRKLSTSFLLEAHKNNEDKIKKLQEENRLIAKEITKRVSI